MASEKSKGRKWDGKSRVSNDLYRKNYNKIFRKKEHIDDKLKGSITMYEALIDDPFNKKVKEEKMSDEEFQKIIDRNGF